MIVDSFQGAVVSVVDYIFVHPVEDRPRTIAGRLLGPTRPWHFISDPSQQVRITLCVLLGNVLLALRAVSRLPPVIHRVGVKDAIQGHPHLHPQFSQDSNPTGATCNLCASVPDIHERLRVGVQGVASIEELSNDHRFRAADFTSTTTSA
jgi:hypothetical protein